MLSEREKKILAARWLGEGIREISVLILVFVPLDWFLGAHSSKVAISFLSIATSALLFWCGISIGYRGEVRIEARQETEDE